MDFNHDYELLTKPNLEKRVYAGLVDYVIIFGYTGVIMYLYGEPNDEGGYSLNGLPGFSVMVFWFIMTIGIEQVVGATIGNKIQNLRPAPIKDIRKSLTIGQSLKRHLLDIVDIWPFGLLGILTIKKTVYNQRLGDLWADSVVLDMSDPEQGLMNKTDANKEY